MFNYIYKKNPRETLNLHMKGISNWSIVIALKKRRMIFTIESKLVNIKVQQFMENCSAL